MKLHVNGQVIGEVSRYYQKRTLNSGSWIFEVSPDIRMEINFSKLIKFNVEHSPAESWFNVETM